jgi:hypothetical protein
MDSAACSGGLPKPQGQPDTGMPKNVKTLRRTENNNENSDNTQAYTLALSTEAMSAGWQSRFAD